MCLTPISVNKRTVPCGNCAVCRQQHRAAWAFRLDQEAFVSPVSLFVTLTYEDNNLLYANDDTPVLNYPDLRNYMKKLRKKGLKFKYFAVGEYGEKRHRPHYHVLFFLKEVIHNDLIFRSEWSFGHIHVKVMNHANIRYCLKDMLKFKGAYSHLEKEFRPQIRVSHGMGIDYLKKRKNYHKVNAFDVPLGLPLQGKPSNLLPRYYRNKIYSNFELSLQGLKMQYSALERVRLNPENPCDSKIYYQKVDQLNKRSQAIRHAGKKL
nr:MAG: replication initiator protein [Microvirus sp.]